MFSSFRSFKFMHVSPVFMANRQLKVRMRLHDLVVLFKRQDAPRIGQGMNDNGRVLPRLNDLVEVADGPKTHGERQRAVMPHRACGLEQVTSGKVGRRHILMRCDRDQRLSNLARCRNRRATQ